MFDKFLYITGVDLKLFFQESSNFLLEDSPIIKSYYLGEINSVPKEISEKFIRLYNEYYQIDGVIKNYSGQFETADFWGLIDMFDDIGGKLEMIKSYDKWLRSNRVSFINSGNISIPIILKQNQTLEDITRNSSVPWERIAEDNDLNEEKYTDNGGNKLNLTFSQGGSAFKVDSIIDNPVGENVYGKDLDLEFKFNENDLLCLDNRNTLFQSFKILLQLTRGSIPEDVSLGVQKNLMIGNSIKGASYPIFIRQLFDNFKTDDSFSVLSIDTMERIDDSIHIGVSVKTRIGESLSEKILV